MPRAVPAARHSTVAGDEGPTPVPGGTSVVELRSSPRLVRRHHPSEVRHRAERHQLKGHGHPAPVASPQQPLRVLGGECELERTSDGQREPPCPALELRRTGYDVAAAARRIRASGYPGRDSYAAQLLAPPAEDAMLDLFSRFELT